MPSRTGLKVKGPTFKHAFLIEQSKFLLGTPKSPYGFGHKSHVVLKCCSSVQQSLRLSH